MKNKVIKNIMPKSSLNIMGLAMSWSQLIGGVVALAVGLLEFFLIKNVGINLKMGIITGSMLVLIAFTVVQINGMSFAKFLYEGFKGVDIRPFNETTEGDEF